MIVLRYMLLGLGLCVLATLGWRFIYGPLGPSIQSRTARQAPALSVTANDQLAEARGIVLARMRDVPEFKAFYDQLAATYPHVEAALVEGAAKRLAQSGVLASPEAMLWDALRVLQQSQGIMASRAGQDILTAFFESRLAMLDALAPADPKLCADFLYGTTDSSIDAFSADHHALVAALAMNELAAIRDGRQHPPETARPTPADIDLIAAGMARRNLTPDEVAVLIDGKLVDPPIADARLCEMGRVYLSVLRALPPDARQRVYGFAAELLARS